MKEHIGPDSNYLATIKAGMTKPFFAIAVLICFSHLLEASPSRIEKVTFFSSSLGVEKSFNIYLPGGYDDCNDRYPVVYLNRGGEDEWVKNNIKDLVDRKISTGEVGKMILVFPGLTYEGNRAMGFPVNMINTEMLGEREGLGSGKFEDYFVRDLIPYVDRKYRTISKRRGRGIDGWSGGGVTSILLGVKYPDLFQTVGAYDAPWGYLDFDDPAKVGIADDSIWMKLEWADPWYGNPRNVAFMKSCNSVNIIKESSGKHLRKLHQVSFFIRAASENAQAAWFEGTYYPRTVHLVKMMDSKGIKNLWDVDTFVLSPSAEHEWADALVYIDQNLELHWGKLSK
ncbi:alpha/beta hydrolase [Bacteroidota bacterium]